MTPVLIHAFSKAIYTRLKEDSVLQKSVAGIFTHAPNSIQGTYLIYSIDPLKILTPVTQQQAAQDIFENRATGRFSVTAISEEGNNIAPLVHHINALLHEQNLALKDNNSLIGHVLCRLISHHTTDNNPQRKRYVTVVFENFLRF